MKVSITRGFGSYGKRSKHRRRSRRFGSTKGRSHRSKFAVAAKRCANESTPGTKDFGACMRRLLRR